ncbi:hypothetical protein GCM10025771_16600 [Niveibacterium umoris]|uniref:Fibronectin type-III domain-containing protein n=1 Tax=Niveibacterium umoris TaxID=1193620 RepID=A0A840BNB6_9RHOO|nr:hypothetical protein [Niveibacterium umoris]MBB4014470.1 hypothetical protein [Niveibacterium umoris]
MLITRSRLHALATLTSLALLAACGGSNDTKPAAPTGFSVTPGDGRVTITWNDDPTLTYWVFSARGVGVDHDNFRKFPDPRITVPVRSGTQIISLINGETYSFFMNASEGNGPAGPETGTLTAVPTISGATWKTGKVGSGGSTLRNLGVAYGNLIAVGDSGAIFTCTLGPMPCANWVQKSGTDTSATYHASAFSPNLIRTVVVGATADGKASIWTNTATSTDTTLTTWAAATSNPISVPLRAVTLGTAGFVAVGDKGRVATSADGLTWTEYKLKAPASGSTIWTAATATDCTIAPNCTLNLNSIIYFNGTFFATGEDGTLVTSPDAVSWNKQTVTSESGVVLHAINYSSTLARYVLVGADATDTAGRIYTSPDAVKWTEQPVPGLPALNVIVQGSRFVALGVGGQPWFSSDGITWSNALDGTSVTGAGIGRAYSAIWSYGEYVAVGANNSIEWSYHPALK